MGPEADPRMAPIAERPVLGRAAPAQSDACVLTDQTTLAVDDLDPPPNEEWAVGLRLDRRVVLRLFLNAAVEAAEVERARRTSADNVRDLVRLRGVDVDPRTPLRIEAEREAADAVARVDAQLRLPVHLDRVVCIDAPRAALRLGELLAHSGVAGSRTTRSRCSGCLRRYAVTNGQTGATRRPRARMSSSAPLTSGCRGPCLRRRLDLRVHERDHARCGPVPDPADQLLVLEKLIAELLWIVSDDVIDGLLHRRPITHARRVAGRQPMRSARPRPAS